MVLYYENQVGEIQRLIKILLFVLKIIKTSAVKKIHHAKRTLYIENGSNKTKNRKSKKYMYKIGGYVTCMYCAVFIKGY